MDNLILSQIPLEDLLTSIRSIIKEEMLSDHPHNEGLNEKPVSTADLSEYLGITEQSINRLRKRGSIPFIQVGGSIRYNKAAVVKTLENKKKKAI